MAKLSKEMKVDIRNIINSGTELSNEMRRRQQSALDGDKENQYLLVEALAHGHHGVPQNPLALILLAEFDWGLSRRYVVEGYSKGMYGIPQNPVELKKLAELDWGYARVNVVIGYFEEKYGFKSNPEELLRLAELDWPLARKNVLWALENPDTFLDTGLPRHHGFKRDADKAKELRKKWGI